MNSNIRQEIINTIKTNDSRLITGNILQGVLLDMFDRDVFLTQTEYDRLVDRGLIDEDKIYHIYEED
jgi:hypothetical protein